MIGQMRVKNRVIFPDHSLMVSMMLTIVHIPPDGFAIGGLPPVSREGQRPLPSLDQFQHASLRALKNYFSLS